MDSMIKVDIVDNSLERAFAQISAGKMVVITPEGRDDSECDLVMAAERVTPEHVNFMARYGRGIISVAITEKRMRELRIPLLPASEGRDANEQVGASVEARRGVSTGISAGDRARTIQTVASATSGPDDLVMPGHIPPLMALEGGVLMRIGRAETAVDLVRMAGMRPCGVRQQTFASSG